MNPILHGGAGNFHIPVRAVSGMHPVVGEEAGFQGFLWGFGMRYAIVSGVLAARRRYNSHRRDVSCDHINCARVWCRHGDHRIAGADKARGS